MLVNKFFRQLSCLTFSVLFSCLFIPIVSAEITPYSGEEILSLQQQSVFTACGLVETTWDDPDWLMATSDHILRSHDCIAECAECPECWYNQPFDPCYVTNRYWKFEENSGTAFAFPMAALGVGTFDGIYIRRNVKFQIYSGSDENNPFGPLMTGPKYISIDHWRDVNVACEGFEPDTFFVTGGPGALSNYSIKIGGDTDIESIDFKKEDNMEAHHTNKFENYYVLRRGSSFEIDVRLGNEYGPGCHDVYFEATHSFDDNDITIEIPPLEVKPPEGQWGSEFSSAVTNGDKTKTVTIKIHIPANVPIGEYRFKAFVRNKDTIDPTDEKEFNEPITIVFNPWSTNDEVYWDKDSSQLEEYVLNTEGLIWKKQPPIAPINWRFNQFDQKTLEVVMFLLEGVPSSIRTDPKLISRYLSKMTNRYDDNGVVYDRWGDDYSGGVAPWFWTGSDQIISRYAASKKPVRYGQCWVFGGVLTSFLRCVGIPARPITNFNSAHDEDKPVDKAIDFYFDTFGFFDRARSEKVWNFHVWCDAYIAKGWNAVDGTPQERSDGEVQMGPAPHYHIRNDLGGIYDVDFVFAEVDAVINKWRDIIGLPPILTSTDTTSVGLNITTKAVGANSANDITGAYKTPESATLMLAQTAPDVGIAVDIPENTLFGTDIVWEVRLTNNSSSNRTIHVVIGGAAINYNGSFIDTVNSVDTVVNLDPSETDRLIITIPVSTYTAWTDITRTFEAAIFASVEETGDVLLDLKRTVLVVSEPVLTLTGSHPVAENNSVNLRVQWVNPLFTELTNVRVNFSVGEALSISGSQEVEVNLGNLAGGGNLDTASDITAVSKGTHSASVIISADQISDVRAYKAISVFNDCNNNDVDDKVDIESGNSSDCNLNELPDECEEDCNANDIPDDCDIASGLAIDCNGNKLPDSCDLITGVSSDDNENSIPDECEVDCNNNDRPDDIDITSGSSSDYNGNGVPDECDEDCNGNGISDEIDISLGDSLDDNYNGVPDDCETTIINNPPVAMCQDITVAANSSCSGEASIDNGSFDPDDNTITLNHSPSGPYELGDTVVTLTVTDEHGASDSCNASVTVEDQEAPVTQAIVPDSGEALQDGITFEATGSDNCGVDEVSFSIREPNGSSGTPIGYEGLVATFNSTSGKWEHDFDTTQLPDGYYVLLAKASDNSGNDGWSASVPFSIRNWAVLDLLPSTANNKAGRTIPVKFALRIVASVDPTTPFVRNEDLEIRICNETEETIYQSCSYGDSSTDYRIGTDLYITNFKTFKQTQTYLVQIWRPNNFLVGEFTFQTTK